MTGEDIAHSEVGKALGEFFPAVKEVAAHDGGLHIVFLDKVIVHHQQRNVARGGAILYLRVDPVEQVALKIFLACAELAAVFIGIDRYETVAVA